jgi:Tol biopolymer transport system component
MLKERGFSIVHCARSPSNLCVVDQRDQNQLVFFAFDAIKGKGRELTGVDFGPAAANYFWDLSPDGSSVALVMPDGRKDRIRIVSLTGGASRDVTVDGWSNLEGGPHWSADGKGWFCSSQSEAKEVLLYVNLEGHAQVLWRQASGGGIYGMQSPDGRYLAFGAWTKGSNAWMIENF